MRTTILNSGAAFDTSVIFSMKPGFAYFYHAMCSVFVLDKENSVVILTAHSLATMLVYLFLQSALFDA